MKVQLAVLTIWNLCRAVAGLAREFADEVRTYAEWRRRAEEFNRITGEDRSKAARFWDALFR